MSHRIQVENRHVEISHPARLLFPQDNITKQDLAEYYARIGETMLPYLQGRPLTLQRFPNGIDAPGFYQKEVGPPGRDHLPDWVSRVAVEVKGQGNRQYQLVCNNVATLVYLVDWACITPHIWLSRTDRLNYPDKLIFDLDPPDSDFAPARFAARALRALLQDIGMISFVMTSGSRGLHVVVPLDRSADFDASRAFAQAVARQLADRYPDRLTTEIRESERHGRLFLDYLRNAYAQNSVAPYAVRAKPGAPVATPIDWDELEDETLHAQTYRMGNILQRMEHQSDPWERLFEQTHAVSSVQEAAGLSQ